ncbi:hypothetical protein IAS59_004556 [Cryptococcus gattii]
MVKKPCFEPGPGEMTIHVRATGICRLRRPFLEAWLCWVYHYCYLRRELIGLVVTLLAAHAAGCPLIVISDLFPSRLEFAKKLLPPARTVQIEKTAKLEEVRKQIKDEAGMEFSLALDYTRMESSIRSAIFSVKVRDKVFVISVRPPEQTANHSATAESMRLIFNSRTIKVQIHD